jgi:hypothetical protein
LYKNKQIGVLTLKVMRKEEEKEIASGKGKEEEGFGEEIPRGSYPCL